MNKYNNLEQQKVCNCIHILNIMTRDVKTLYALTVFVIVFILYYTFILGNERNMMSISTNISLKDIKKLYNDLNRFYKKDNRTVLERKNIDCYNTLNSPRLGMRGNFFVLYNYVNAERTFRCNESVTYTTHSDFRFLDNLLPILQRYQGPVSLALHAPGTDFYLTVSAIDYARECLSPLVKEYVTFHIYFEEKYIPEQISMVNRTFNCSEPAPWMNISNLDLFRTRNKILYPVNVGRNIALDTALTHYVLRADIELYPSPGLIEKFLAMLSRQDSVLLSSNPKVFPLATFEVEKDMMLPDNKSQLVNMLRNKSAIPFHEKMCIPCHNFPMSKVWREANESSGLSVFHIGKRLGQFKNWEPFYIGTHMDPPYDERMSWDGQSNKMTQGYAMCLLDYDFMILDNAFLVHKPGIKRKRSTNNKALASTKVLIEKTIEPQIRRIYGTRKGCQV